MGETQDVFLGFLHGNDVASSFWKSLDMLRMHDLSNNQRLAKYADIRTPGYGIPEGRNTVAKAVVESDCEWLFMVDSDMGFTPDTLDRLLAAAHPKERPIVGALCFAYKEAGHDGYWGSRFYPLPTIFKPAKDECEPEPHPSFVGIRHYPVNQLIRTAATGAACLVIHRTVLERIRDRFGEVWFDRFPGPHGLNGEDISFFMRVNALEIPSYIHTGIKTTHRKSIYVSDADFWLSFDPPPAATKVDVVVPTVKARFGNLEPLHRSLVASTGLADCWFVVDEDEHRGPELESWGAHVLYKSGSFPVKLNYWWANADSTRPWFQIVGDDCRFRHSWLDHCLYVAEQYDAKVVSPNDLANDRVVRGEHATHPFINRQYVTEVGAGWDGPDTLAHDGYHHWYVDDEISQAAIQRGVFQAATGGIVEHVHPITGQVPTDDVYQANDAHAAVDRKLFLKRLAANQ